VDKLPSSLVTVDEYLRIYEFVNEKLSLTKETAQKLKTSFDIVRGAFVADLAENGGDYFEALFVPMPVEQSPRQSEYLYLLTQIVLTNERALTKWRQIYAKNFQQSL
jgi:hypothetical protein